MQDRWTNDGGAAAGVGRFGYTDTVVGRRFEHAFGIHNLKGEMLQALGQELVGSIAGIDPEKVGTWATSSRKPVGPTLARLAVAYDILGQARVLQPTLVGGNVFLVEGMAQNGSDGRSRALGTAIREARPEELARVHAQALATLRVFGEPGTGH